MAITVNGISCEEIVHSYGEGATLQGLSSRKGYLCDWDDRFTVAKGLLGLSSTTGVGGTITLTAPSRHPELLNCFCTSVEFEGKGKPFQGSTQLAFPKCIVWGIYSSVNFTWGAPSPYMNIDPTTQFVYAEQEIDVAVEVLTIPGRSLRYYGTIRPVRQDFGLRIGIVDLKITLHRVPYLPGQAILQKAGEINDATYLGVGPGKLLFNGAHNRLQVLSDGAYTQDITYSFTARTQPWDYAYDAVSSSWKRVVQIDGSDLMTRQSFIGLFPDEYY